MGSCSSAPNIRTKFVSAMTKARARTVGPTTVGIVFRSGAMSAVRPLTAKPTNGSRTIAPSRTGSKWCTSPPQQVEVLQIHRLGVAEDRDHDRESHGRLGRRHRHDEEHEHLTLDPDRARERDEGEVHGVEHQLDAE